MKHRIRPSSSYGDGALRREDGAEMRARLRRHAQRLHGLVRGSQVDTPGRDGGEVEN